MPIDKIKNKQTNDTINSFENLKLFPTLNVIIDKAIVKVEK